MAKVVNNVTELIGGTPLVRLNRIVPEDSAEIYLKLDVHFMGESAKILAPNKTVLIPDERAGCPMADMVNVDGLRKLKAKHPNAKVVTYINSSAEIKAETDICCTSSNAVKVIQSVDSDEII